MNAFFAAIYSPVVIQRTPRRLVWALNKARLYRYEPFKSPSNAHAVPLLIVYAPIGRPKILDLHPRSSLVKFLAGRGYDVYVLDWGAPGPEDRRQSFEDCVLGYLPRAIRKIQYASGRREFSLLGWSLSGIFASIYAALRPGDGIRNLILVTAPLDFSDRSVTLVRHLSDRNFNVDLLLAAYGNIPGQFLAWETVALRPVELTAGALVQLWDNLSNPEFVGHWRAQKDWATDLVPIPGVLFKQLVVDLYRENKLMKGDLTVAGETVDLRRISANLLNIVAQDDFVSPPVQCESIMNKVSSADRLELRLPGTHVEVAAGAEAPFVTWPRLDDWLSHRSD